MSGKMEKDTSSTRRAFLKSGTILGLPLAAVAAPAVVMADDELKTRLARLENEAAIREVHQRWVRSISTGAGDAGTTLFAGYGVAGYDPTVCGIAPDHGGQPDVIRVAANGQSASGRFHCTVDFETPIAQDCTVARMAHAQGGGFVRRTERRVLNVEYAKTSGAWNIAKVEFENGIS
jgi:hypothetical protein